MIIKRYFVLFLLLGFVSCDKDSQDGVPLVSSDIVGSWQIVSESYSIGGPQISAEVKNGAIYSFSSDGTFVLYKSDLSSVIYSGTFDYKDEVITLNYVRDGEAAYWDLKTSFEDDFLTWYPIGPTICIEGCSTTLKRLVR